MKYVFDWETFNGCLGCLGILIGASLIIAVGYFLIHILLFLLPAIVSIASILAIPLAIGYLIREMFFKKVE